jgi:hypothetical protein
LEIEKKDKENKEILEKEQKSEIRKGIEKKTLIEKTFDFGDQTRIATDDTPLAKLEDRTVTLIKRNDGTSDFTFGVLITSLGWRTSNAVTGEGNPLLSVTFFNQSEGVLFTKEIETESYSSNYYHGITVRCEYDRKRQAPEYSAGNIPFESVYWCALDSSYGNTWFRC